jgi:hypothetical protein
MFYYQCKQGLNTFLLPPTFNAFLQAGCFPLAIHALQKGRKLKISFSFQAQMGDCHQSLGHRKKKADRSKLLCNTYKEVTHIFSKISKSLQRQRLLLNLEGIVNNLTCIICCFNDGVAV